MKNKKTILFVHHSPAWGGGTMSLFDIVSLIQERYNIELALPKGENEVKRYAVRKKYITDETAPNTCVFRYYNGGPSFIKVLGSYFSTRKNLTLWRLYLKEKKPDILLLNSIVLWPLLPIAKKLGIPTVLFIRESKKKTRITCFNSLIRKIINKNAFAVSFLSNYDRVQWNLNTNILTPVIPDCIDVRDFYNQGALIDHSNYFKNKSDSDIYLLFAGGINRLKGTLTMVKAMRYLPDNIKLYIIGDCGKNLMHSSGLSRFLKRNRINYIKQVTQIISDSNIKNRICLLDTITDMASWYKSCDMCVVPIVEAHQSRSVYEAGAMKKPVVITDFDNYKEYVKDGVNALTFEMMNDKQLAEKILMLSQNSELRIHLGETNQQYALLFHNKDKACQTINETIIKLLNI